MTWRVKISPRAVRQLEKIPSHIVRKLQVWADDVEHRGLEDVRRTPGYHDEPLKGDRRGQRSIRLSIHYRAIYEMDREIPRVVEVQEVTKHEY